MGEVIKVDFGRKDTEQPVAEVRPKILELKRDPIAEVLPTEARAFYESKIPSQTRMFLAKALRRTERWVNDDTNRKINPDFQENNLDHVIDLVKAANYAKNNFPQLYLELTQGDDQRWLDLITMLVTHDLGEFYTGDLACTHTGFDKEDGRKHKAREAWAARKLLTRGGGEIKERLVELYDRFDHREVSDAVVRFGHVLDKGQAAANVARHVLPFSDKVDSSGYIRSEDMLNSIRRPMEYAVSVSESLLSKEAKKQFAAFLEEFFLGEFRKLNKKLDPDEYEKVFWTVQVAYRGVLHL